MMGDWHIFWGHCDGGGGGDDDDDDDYDNAWWR